nr:MAG TPA: hypothetical protein [Caudoviricetes sp.]
MSFLVNFSPSMREWGFKFSQYAGEILRVNFHFSIINRDFFENRYL